MWTAWIVKMWRFLQWRQARVAAATPIQAVLTRVAAAHAVPHRLCLANFQPLHSPNACLNRRFTSTSHHILTRERSQLTQPIPKAWVWHRGWRSSRAKCSLILHGSCSVLLAYNLSDGHGMCDLISFIQSEEQWRVLKQSCKGKWSVILDGTTRPG